MKTKLLLFFAICLTAFSVNAQVNSVALVGEAAGGWPGDPGNPGPTDIHQMTSTDGENWTLSQITLTGAASGGGVKFRANNDWTINWGSASFPDGTGTQGGANILCIAGTYDVSFNSTTGVYSFSGGTPPSVVKLVGTAVSDIDGIPMSTTDLIIFTATNVTLLDGLAQFDVDGLLAGGDTYPTGTALDETMFIPVPAGTYSTITVNIGSGEYNFVAAPVYPSIAIVGSGAGGWPNDPQTDANQLSTEDGETYTGVVTLTADAGSNEIKFRSNNNWSDPNWGGFSFPTGPDAGNPGGNIVVTAAGTYDVVFTRSTGAYAFSVATFALVGSGAGGWPTGTPGEVDVNQMTTTDNGRTYELNGVTLTDGETKFRANNAWDINFGAADFPSGTATQGGANIPVTSGTYNVTLDRVTGAYTFTDGTFATTTFSNKNFSAYPNPTNTVWNFTSTSEVITSVQVVDVLGKVVANSSTTTVDASTLNNGIYFARVSSENGSQVIKLVKN